MPSGSFNTQTATMAQTATHVQDVKDQIDGELKTLFSAVEGVRAHWSGDAAAAFQQLMQSYQTDSQKLGQALTQISEQIAQSGRSYASSEEQNTSALRRSGSGLNL